MLHYSSNITFCCNHTNLLLVFIYICLLEWFHFSRSIKFTCLMNCFKYLLVSSLWLTGQLPTLRKLFFSFYLSFFSLLHWNIRRSNVCVPCLHGHSGLPREYCSYWKLRKEAINFLIYTSEDIIKKQRFFVCFLLGNKIENSVNCRLEIRIQQTNKFEICDSLPEHNKSRIHFSPLSLFFT
jgi:hypothetical protein